MNFGKILRFWFPVLVYSGIIFTVSSIPSVKKPLDLPEIDKILHVFEYIPFGFLLTYAMINTTARRSKRALWRLVVLGTFLYALSDEYHQSFVPGREASLIDVWADTVGGFIGSWFYFWLQKGKLHDGRN